jgi:hypothetical protein
VAQEVARLLSEALDAPKRLSSLDLKGLGEQHWRGIDAPAGFSVSSRTYVQCTPAVHTE